MRLTVEFTTEPFDLDEPPAHALAAREVIQDAGLDAVDVGPFGNTAEGADDAVLDTIGTLLRRSLGAGATRITLQVNAADGAGPAQEPSAAAAAAQDAAPAEDPFVHAVRPLVAAVGGELLPPQQAGPDDVVLSWRGTEAVAVRLPHLADSLGRILAALEHDHGRPLADLDRRAKQRVVRTLEARGAFTVRHGVETVAHALGVSRFTVYNYLNRENSGEDEQHVDNEGNSSGDGTRDGTEGSTGEMPSTKC